jgi:protein-S-isoprenylcysteine O-methyltransferase Ste14
MDATLGAASRLYATALLVAVAGAYLRVAAVAVGALRTLRARSRFRTFRFGPVEAACVLEPLVLAGVAYVLNGMRGTPVAPSPTELAAAVGGAALVLAGWALIVWTWWSWPTIFTGHGVLEGHRLVDRGAYGVIRHPVYAAAFLIWFGLALAFASGTAFLITVAYVVPVYLLYMRSEEAMMRDAFGEKYERYRERVPMLIPRRPRAQPGPSGPTPGVGRHAG